MQQLSCASLWPCCGSREKLEIPLLEKMEMPGTAPSARRLCAGHEWCPILNFPSFNAETGEYWPARECACQSGEHSSMLCADGVSVKRACGSLKISNIIPYCIVRDGLEISCFPSKSRKLCTPPDLNDYSRYADCTFNHQLL